MIRARAYAPGDARLIEARDAQRVEARVLYGALAHARPPGPAYTILDGDTAIACGGLIPVWPGYAQAWGFAGALPPRAALAIVRQFARALAVLAALQAVNRIEATARCDFPLAQRFLEKLQFARVAKLDRYGPDGGDYWLYALLPEQAGGVT